jgi:hypothetical protein
MRKSLRYLRVAWTVLCSIACVLLIVLWVRSYWWIEVFELPLTAKYSVRGGSFPGVCGLGFPYTSLGQCYSREPSNATWQYDKYEFPSSLSGTFIFDTRSALVPYWFALGVLVAVAAIPWVRWRFNLRTLLIATTLVAMMLGLIVRAAKS